MQEITKNQILLGCPLVLCYSRAEGRVRAECSKSSRGGRQLCEAAWALRNALFGLSALAMLTALLGLPPEGAALSAIKRRADSFYP